MKVCIAGGGRVGMYLAQSLLSHHHKVTIIEPHNGDWQRFTDPSNLQSLCHGCHSAKTMAESRAKGKTKRR